MNIEKVGLQISELRKNKGLTQNDLGERLGVSFQAVSKWERGETLPDTTILPELKNRCTKMHRFFLFMNLQNNLS